MAAITARQTVNATVQQPLDQMDVDQTAAAQALEDILQKCGTIDKPGKAIEFFYDKKYRAVGSQQLSAKCFFCHMPVTSTGSTKLLNHLMSCVLTPKTIKDAFISLRSLTESKRKAKAEVISVARDEAQLAVHEHNVQQKKLKQAGIKSGLMSAECAAADMAIAEFFYANGLSFFAASPEADSYYRGMIQAIQQAPSSYIPPNRVKLAGPLLDECHTRMWKKVEMRDEDGKLAAAFGSTYVSDGWDSCDHLPLINSAFIKANDGGVCE